jgi:hypothetical protein
MLINEFGFGKDVRSAGFHLYPLSTVSVSKTPAAGGGGCSLPGVLELLENIRSQSVAYMQVISL